MYVCMCMCSRALRCHTVVHCAAPAPRRSMTQRGAKHSTEHEAIDASQ